MFAAIGMPLKGGIGAKESGDVEATPPSSEKCRSD
jgi:hypothetical protein